ncbi:hypothetical protein D9M73_217160 [compost metagenome]
MALGQLTQQRQDDDAAKGRRQAQTQGAAGFAATVEQQLLGLLEPGQQRGATLAQQQAVGGQADAAGVAVQQLDPQLFLQAANRPRQSGLGQAGAGGRGGEAALLGDLEQQGNGVQVHD